MISLFTQFAKAKWHAGPEIEAAMSMFGWMIVRPLWLVTFCTQVRETVRDVTFLHNEQFFAAAQKKYVYIYDKRGLEVHCLKVRPPLGAADLIYTRCVWTYGLLFLVIEGFTKEQCFTLGSVLMQEHTGVRRLEFLPHHFLLTSVGEGGVLRYQVALTFYALAAEASSNMKVSYQRR